MGWLIIGSIFASERGVHHFNALPGGDPLRVSPYYRTAAVSIGVFSTTFTQCAPKATEFGAITQIRRLLRHSTSFKVSEYGTDRKLIGDFLVINS